MPNIIYVDVNSSAIQLRYNQLHRPIQALVCSGLPMSVMPESVGQVIRTERGRLLSGPANWGRAGADRHLDASPAAGARRGLIAATSFEMEESYPEHSWDARTFRISVKGEPFFMIGVSLHPDLNAGADFSVLMTSAGLDLRSIFAREPVIVPPSKWAEWVDPNCAGDLRFPAKAGTFSLRVV